MTWLTQLTIFEYIFMNEDFDFDFDFVFWLEFHWN